MYLYLGCLPSSPGVFTLTWEIFLIPQYVDSDLLLYPYSSEVSTLTWEVSLVPPVCLHLHVMSPLFPMCFCWPVFLWNLKDVSSDMGYLLRYSGLSTFAWHVFLIPQLCLPWHWMFPVFLRLAYSGLGFFLIIQMCLHWPAISPLFPRCVYFDQWCLLNSLGVTHWPGCFLKYPGVSTVS